MQVAVHHLGGVLAGVRAAAGEHLVEQDARRVDVHPLVGGRVLADLLRRQVRDGAQQLARLGGGGGGRVGGAHHPDQAEVRDLHQPVVGDQHVLRLHVPVHQTRPVRRAERREHRLQHVQGGPHRERAAVAQQLAQGAAGNELHRHEHRARIRALVQHVDHVRVREPGHRLRLADEPRREVGVARQRRVHHLQRDGTVQPGVGAAVDGRHAAHGDPLLDPVAPVEQHTEQGIVQGHVHPRSLGAAAPHARQGPLSIRSPAGCAPRQKAGRSRVSARPSVGEDASA